LARLEAERKKSERLHALWAEEKESVKKMKTNFQENIAQCDSMIDMLNAEVEGQKAISIPAKQAASDSVRNKDLKAKELLEAKPSSQGCDGASSIHHEGAPLQERRSSQGIRQGNES
jgi:hypothetical protein